jgi:PPOX class probable F420-dependent enzyme
VLTQQAKSLLVAKSTWFLEIECINERAIMTLEMSSSELTAFLADKHLARIATVTPEGAPHVTPVWYLWKAPHLFIAIVNTSIKARNIQQNPQVAVTIDTDSSPAQGVIMEGTALIKALPAAVEREICARYVESGDLEPYLAYAQSHFTSVLLQITPHKIRSWNYAKDPFLRTLRSSDS